MFTIISILLLVLYELINSLMINKDIRDYELKLGNKIVDDKVNIVLFNLLPILYVIFITTIVVLFFSNVRYFNMIQTNSLYIFLCLAFVIISAHVYVGKLVDKIDEVNIKDKLRTNGAIIISISVLIVIYYTVIVIIGSNRNRINNPYRNVQGIPGYARVAEI